MTQREKYGLTFKKIITKIGTTSYHCSRPDAHNNNALAFLSQCSKEELEHLILIINISKLHNETNEMCSDGFDADEIIVTPTEVIVNGIHFVSEEVKQLVIEYLDFREKNK